MLYSFFIYANIFTSFLNYFINSCKSITYETTQHTAYYTPIYISTHNTTVVRDLIVGEEGEGGGGVAITHLHAQQSTSPVITSTTTYCTILCCLRA